MSNVTNLRYTCVNELEEKAKINFTGEDPHSVYQTLVTFYQKSHQAETQGDDEIAYFFLKKWLDSAEWLRSNKDYAMRISSVEINLVTLVLAEWKQKLDVRYQLDLKKCNLEEV